MKYALDTNIFIDGFRSEEGHAYLSAVVMQELAAGARTTEAARDVQHGVFEPFERRRRVFAPSAAAFVQSGRVLAAVAGREGWQLVDENPSLLNDALIAASCREQGITLITKDGDFTRLAPFVKGLSFAASRNRIRSSDTRRTPVNLSRSLGMRFVALIHASMAKRSVALGFRNIRC